MLVAERGLSIRLTCRILSVSETCYRNQAKLSDKNAEIADWPIRFIQWQRNWGFGLYFLYLRNVKACVPNIPRTGAQHAHQATKTVS